MNKKQIASLIIGSVVGVTFTTAHAELSAKPMQCYGIAKAHKNDCGTPKHACAGMATSDNNPEEWVFEPSSAACVKAGGNLKAGVPGKTAQ